MTDRPTLARRCLFEGVGTFLLVFMGCSAVVTSANQTPDLALLGVSLVFGLVVSGLIYAGGHLSGAHLNPAVTLAFVAGRHFPARDAATYIGAQLLGATLGALALATAWPSSPAQLGATVPSTSTSTALFYEVLLTGFLMFVITAVATDTRAVGAAAAVAVGGAVALGVFVGGHVSGGSMNPARSLAPALTSGTWTDFWIYVVGPIAGAVVGVLVYALASGSRATGSEPELVAR